MSLSDLPDDILGLISIQLNGFDNCSLWMASDSKLKQRLVNNIITDFDIKYTLPGRYLWPGNFLKRLQRLSRLSLVVDEDVYHLPIEKVELFPIETLKYLKIDCFDCHRFFEQNHDVSSTNSAGPTASSSNEKYINLNDFYPNLEYFEPMYPCFLFLDIHFTIDFLRFLPQKLKTFSMPQTHLRVEEQDAPNLDISLNLAALPRTLTALSISTWPGSDLFFDCSVLPPNLTSLKINAMIDQSSYAMIPKSLKILNLGHAEYNIEELSPYLPTGLENLYINSSCVFGDSLAHLEHLEFFETYSLLDNSMLMTKYPRNLKTCRAYFDGSGPIQILPLPHGLVELCLGLPQSVDQQFIRSLPSTITSLYLRSKGSSSPAFEFFTGLPKYLKYLETDLPIVENMSLLPESLTELRLDQEDPCQIERDRVPSKLETLVLAGVLLSNTALKTLPEKLKELNLKCEQLYVDDEVISSLPRGLTQLTLEAKFNLTDASASKCPPKLRHLYLKGNDEMTDDAIIDLPRGLKRLHLPNNTKLTDKCIQHLPRGLIKLKLPQCAGITKSCVKDLPKYISLVSFNFVYSTYDGKKFS